MILELRFHNYSGPHLRLDLVCSIIDNFPFVFDCLIRAVCHVFLIFFCCQDFDTSMERQALVKHEMFKHENYNCQVLQSVRDYFDILMMVKTDI